MVDWIVKTLSQYGLAGLVIGGLSAAVAALWRKLRHNEDFYGEQLKQSEARNQQLQTRIQHLEDHRARMLEKLLEAARSRGNSVPPRKVSPSPTSYSITTQKSPTRD